MDTGTDSHMLWFKATEIHSWVVAAAQSKTRCQQACMGEGDSLTFQGSHGCLSLACDLFLIFRVWFPTYFCTRAFLFLTAFLLTRMRTPMATLSPLIP